MQSAGFTSLSQTTRGSRTMLVILTDQAIFRLSGPSYPEVMRQEIQWYLAEQLANARTTKGTRMENRDRTMASFSGALSALRYVDELTTDEENDWNERMRLALDMTASRTVLRRAGEGEPLPSAPSPVGHDPYPRFVRSIPGPDTEYELYGGRLRIVAVEIYDKMVSVRWRAAPEPDLWAAFPEEAAQLAHDVEGTDAWAVEALAQKAERRMRAMRLYNFGLTDDVGTEYHGTGGGHRGGGNDVTGEARFSPAPPPNATRLTITWLDLTVDIALP